MKALSVRQPWAWLIMHEGKDIENRVWLTHVRGRVAIHAAGGMTRAEYDSVAEAVEAWGIVLPPAAALERGGLVGTVELVDCVHVSGSRWFSGPYGFVLRDPRPMTFQPLKGRLGWFDLPVDAPS